MATTLTSDIEKDIGALPFAPGDLVARRYSIVRLVAQGGMGLVYEVRNLHDGQCMALKCLRPERAFSEVGRARFQREAQLLEHLKHETIVRIVERGVHDGQTPFIVMEYLDGVTLNEFLKVGVRPTIPATLEIAAQICDAVAFAHSIDIVHRDLKPANIMLLRRSDNVTVKLLDFGIGALRSGIQTQLTASGADLGTACYLSPEQARGTHSDGKASDVYAIGLILTELLTGKRVYSGASYNAVLFDILTRPLRPIIEVVPDCPPQLAAVIDRSLAIDPERRYPDAIKLLESLEQVRSTLLTRPTLAPITSSVKPLGNIRPWIWASATAAIVSSLTIGLMRLPTRAEPSQTGVREERVEQKAPAVFSIASPTTVGALEPHIKEAVQATSPASVSDSRSENAPVPTSASRVSSPRTQHGLNRLSKRPSQVRAPETLEPATRASSTAASTIPLPTLMFQTQNPY